MPNYLLDPFDGENATSGAILVRAAKLVGRTPRQLIGAVQVAERDKGAVGQLVERCFGIRQNSDQAPDFRAAGIELKVVPLTRGKRGLRVKERTVVTVIDWEKLAREAWATASLREKLARVLFVFYEDDGVAHPLDVVLAHTLLWEPDAQLLPQMSRDWHAVHAKVLSGNAHRVSEGDGRVLGACTKGAVTTFVKQPFSEQLARRRAWALKSSLTTWIYNASATGKKAQIEELHATLKVRHSEDFESSVVRELRRFSGFSLEEIASELHLKLGSGKAGPAFLVRHAIGVTNNRARIREFEERGISIKTVPLSSAGKPYEAMSFPNFDHMELATEEWDESDLLSDLQRLLVIPLIRETRKTTRGKQVLGTPFFWTPTAEEFDIIEAEWRDYVSRIVCGEAKKLPGYASTQLIHIRPHARNAADTEPAPFVGEVTKKCFWLNPSYIERIVRENDGLRGAV